MKFNISLLGFTVAFFLCGMDSSIRAQTDYRKLPLWDSMLSCGNQDTVLTHRLIAQLKAINPDTLTNRKIYYKDLGMCYYDLFCHSFDTGRLREAIRQYNLSLKEDSTYYYSWWNAAVSYSLLNDCRNSNLYMKRYLALAPRKSWDKSTISNIKKRCKQKS